MWTTSSSTTTKSRGSCTCARPRASGGATSASIATASRRCAGLLRSFDLRTVQQPARGRIEGIAPMQRATVVPRHDVAHAPFLPESEPRPGGVRPERIQQLLAFREIKAFDVAVAPSPQKETLASGLRVCAHERMTGARRFARIANVLIA